MTTTSVVEYREEGAVKVFTNDFEVLRYIDGTPLHLRNHQVTMGNGSGRFEPGTGQNWIDTHPFTDMLEVQERSETWEEEMCEVCGASAPTAKQIKHTEEECFK